MSCMFLWIEFFKWINDIRRVSHDEKIVPFAMTTGDGEIGYNIDSRFAAPDAADANQDPNASLIKEENRMVYRSNHLWNMYPKDNKVRNAKDQRNQDKAAFKFDSDNTPLYRYFVPVLAPDRNRMRTKPFDVEMVKDRYTFTFHDIGGNLFALLDSGYKAVMEKDSYQMQQLAAVAKSQTWLKKFAVYNRSIYPYCNPFSEYLIATGAEAFKKRKALSEVLEQNEFSVAFEMGDGGFRVSKPLKADAAVAKNTPGAVTYIGQGQLTPWQHNKCDVNQDLTNPDHFDQVQATKENQSTDEKNTLRRASTYHKSYWLVQLYNDDNFVIGTNGDEILMALDLDNKKQ